MNAIGLIALATFFVALAATTAIARRCCAAPLAWTGLGFGAALLTAFATVTPIGIVLTMVGEWLLRMTPGSLAYGTLNMGIVAPGFEELFRLLFLLVALAYLAGRNGSSWGLGLTFGLAWGLGELFLRCLGFFIMLAGMEPPPILAAMGATAVATPIDATLMFSGRLTIVFWHGAISVLIISGIRNSDARPIWAAIGLHLVGNAASFLLSVLVTPFAASLVVTLVIAAALFWVARKRTAHEPGRRLSSTRHPAPSG